MKARTFKSIEDGVYKVSIYTEDWSENDIGLMTKYDEPEIDIGGTFTGAVTFTLAEQLVRIHTESPFTVSFDSRDFDDADVRASLWATTILTRLNDAIVTLRANDDEFTSETVVTI